ncbi:2-amino-4-hydroxy-6-hydroxymethyldihydropteridine diphosphokinase [Aquirufa regiilacus]|jgi:2-amino-4-hydroxy-6-hydroxymethyldihydropteridine diphosphokinase|uniref:2-amino-4-hydroxy-6-hydroxymethyldihydropteridine pyrophosphokinase n=1 Tax=Aquirufa regiilacus TaxID=3024868 RepID=A0ABU3TU65_9BACT|nr:2-amino-4-hydroxy-6-hydroxymethyldihydropteridine diphosphokinase [Aquirufa sp. LEOWEIH-7C]MDU0809405.1 2-amino-4-hydroxy-6-hydroxymethyldihydropteridine diphosphokinase [Aquirufa sp. LEOWEIH-7C]
MHVFLSLGGNLGNTQEIFEACYPMIENKVGVILQQSSLYRTAAWGLQDQADFTNQVILVETTLNPHTILTEIQAIEKALGRERTITWGPRTLDLDILFIDQQIIQTTDLQVPHPRIQDRKFVLIPMEEIAGNFKHPVFNKSMIELLEETTDETAVSLILNP